MQTQAVKALTELIPVILPALKVMPEGPERDALAKVYNEQLEALKNAG